MGYDYFHSENTCHEHIYILTFVYTEYVLGYIQKFPD
jgi:hypothetical protein